MSLGGAVLNWPTEIWNEFDDVLDITQRESGEAVSEAIDDLFSAFRSLTINLVSRR